jgi:hypothetical protein
VPGTAFYVYEFRDGTVVVATGRLSSEAPLAVGETITINGHAGVVSEVVSTLTPNEQRLIIQRS